MDALGLAKSGFALIRNLLQGKVPGGVEAAECLAEALHNLPNKENEFSNTLLLKNMKSFISKYPEFSSYIKPYIGVE